MGEGEGGAVAEEWVRTDLLEKFTKFGQITSCGAASYTSSYERTAFTGRITPPVNATNTIALIGQYLDKDHAYRTGQIVFPKKMLLYPSAVVDAINNGTDNAKNSLDTNIASSIASQSRYMSQDVDVVEDRDYPTSENNYLDKLKDNRYETALINIHGTPDGQFVSGYYGNSVINAQDIINASPNILYVDLVSCSNGAFESPDYLAGWFLFSGDTLLVSAPSQDIAIGGFLADPPAAPVYFQPLSFLNSSVPLGNLFLHDNSLYLNQYFGDPTLKIQNNPTIPQLEIEKSSIDFGSVGSAIQTSNISIENKSNQNATLLVLPPFTLTVDGNVSGTQSQPTIPVSGQDSQGFSVASYNPFDTITIPPKQTIELPFQFSPAVFKNNNSIVNGKYFSTYTFLTSDPTQPYLDINLTAQYGTSTSASTTSPITDDGSVTIALSTSTATQGQSVVINGSSADFDQYSFILFGNGANNLITPTSFTDHTLTFTVPANATLGSQTIQVGGFPLTNIVPLTIVSAVEIPLSISSLSSGTGNIGDTIIVSGTGFDQYSFVAFDGANGISVTPISVSTLGTSLTFVVPTSLTSGSHELQIQEKGGGEESNVVTFNVNSSAGNSSSTSQVITIDQNSLVTNSAFPTITGTASSASSVYVDIQGYLPAKGEVNDYYSGTVSVVNGKWSFTASPRNSDFASPQGFGSGSYTVRVGFSANNPVVTGTLVVSSGNNASTSAWQTYTNSQYGYQLQYPAGAILLDEFGSNVYTTRSVDFNATSSSFHFQVDVPQTIYQNEDNGQLVCDNFDRGAYNSTIIDGLQFYYGDISNQYESMNNQNGGQGIVSYCTINNGTEYRIIFYPGLSADITNVIDSFKFTN